MGLTDNHVKKYDGPYDEWNRREWHKIPSPPRAKAIKMSSFEFEGLDESSARFSRIKLALIDGIEGVKEFERTGEYDERLELFKTVAEDLPETGRGVFPPLDRTTLDNTEITQALEDIEYLKERATEIEISTNREEFDTDEIIETANRLYEQLDELEKRSRSEYVI